MTQPRIALALHGGAGPLKRRSYAAAKAHMQGLIESGRDRLLAGDSALEVVTQTIRSLEECGYHVAGRGSSPNTDGVYELDASLMDGPTRRAGAVATLVGIASPIEAARAVLERSPHVLLAGDGAGAFARAQGLAQIADPAGWFRPAPSEARTPDMGTVGCVALDLSGALAAGTSTGGVSGKRPGRVGDSPIHGAGCWADDRVAVSCTGQGEMFIRAAVAAQVAHRLRFGGQTLAEAAPAALEDVRALRGEGGLIAVTAQGEIAMPYISAGMKRAALHPDGRIEVAVFAQD